MKVRQLLSVYVDAAVSDTCSRIVKSELVCNEQSIRGVGGGRNWEVTMEETVGL